MKDIPVTHEVILERLAQGEKRFEAIQDSLDKVLETIQQIHDIKTSVDATKELVEAWSAVKTWGRFVKWVSVTVAAIGVLYASAKGIALEVLSGK